MASVTCAVRFHQNTILRYIGSLTFAVKCNGPAKLLAVFPPPLGGSHQGLEEYVELICYVHTVRGIVKQRGATATVDFLARHTQWDASPVIRVERRGSK